MTRVMRIFALIAGAILYTGVVGAVTPVGNGNQISGHVIEAGSEIDIPAASIVILETNRGTIADETGHFSFKNVESGKYTLRVSALGYKTMEKEVLVSTDYVAVVHFALEEESYLTDEVVVSANRNEVSRKEAPVVVNVMSEKLFMTVNAPDLAKTLNYQSGLRVENNCQNCTFPQVRINGLDGPYSQILINSRPVMSALSGVYGLEQIPANMIDRIEVVRGGGSALFGANAVAGTINIITKDPVNNSFQIGGNFSCMDGQSWEQYYGGNASLVSKSNTYGIALYETYRNRNPYDRDGDSFSEVGKLNSNTFGMRAYYRPSHESRINIEYHTTNEFRRGGNKFDLQPHESDITEQTKHIINSGGLTYDQFFKERKHKISLFGSIQHVDRNSYYGTEQDPNAYGKTDDLTWITGAMYVGTFYKCLFAPSVLTAGIEYQNNSLHDIMTGYDRDMKQDVRIASAFLQNEWKMGYFTMLLGLRMDKHNLIDDLIFSPRVNFLYKASEAFQARLTWSTGFRAPQAYDEDLHLTAVGGENVQTILADNLKEERSNSFSASVDWSTSFGHWQANLMGEGFYTDLSDVFVIESISPELQERRNGDGAEVYGGNFDAKIAHGKEFGLQLGFTAQKSMYKSPEVWAETEEGELLTTKKMMRSPNYYGYFTLTSAPVKNFDFSLSGVYTGKMIVPHMQGYIEQHRMESVSDFFDFNAKVNYTFVLEDHMKLQFSAGVQNIFDKFQSDLDKGTYRDAGYFYGPTMPRTYFIGFKLMN